MKNRDDADFLVNEFLEGPQDELKRIVKIAVRRPMPYDRKAAFFKEFTYGLLEAYRRERFKELKKLKEIKVKPEVKKIDVKKPVVKKKVEIDLPPPPRPKLEVYRDIIVGAGGKVFAKAVFKDGIYTLDEPKLDRNSVNVLAFIKKDIGHNVLRKRNLLDDKNYLKRSMIKSSKRLRISYNGEMFDAIRYYFIRDVVNLGRVDALIKDNMVNEIICDGAGKSVIVNYKGNDVGTNIIFNDDEEISKVVMNLAERAGKKIDVKHPFLNVVIGNLSVQANIKSSFSGAKFIIKKA